MGKKEILLEELNKFPEPFLDEVIDFVDFLKAKAAKERSYPAMVSESSLKKDWLLPEEDAAWKNL